MFLAMVKGSFPLGETSPYKTETKAGPACSPGCRGETTAVMLGWSIQASRMVAPGI
jgi:hypothetical protein